MAPQNRHRVALCLESVTPKNKPAQLTRKEVIPLPWDPRVPLGSSLLAHHWSERFYGQIRSPSCSPISSSGVMEWHWHLITNSANAQQGTDSRPFSPSRAGPVRAPRSDPSWNSALTQMPPEALLRSRERAISEPLFRAELPFPAEQIPGWHKPELPLPAPIQVNGLTPSSASAECGSQTGTRR